VVSLRVTISKGMRWEGRVTYGGAAGGGEQSVVAGGRPKAALEFEATVVPESRTQVIPPKT